MNYFYFKKLDVYNYSKELVKYIYLLLKSSQKKRNTLYATSCVEP